MNNGSEAKSNFDVISRIGFCFSLAFGVAHF